MTADDPPLETVRQRLGSEERGRVGCRCGPILSRIGSSRVSVWLAPGAPSLGQTRALQEK